MKKKIMKAGILIVVFCAAVIISSLVINKDVSAKRKKRLRYPLFWESEGDSIQ